MPYLASTARAILSRRMPIVSCLLHDGCYIHALTMHSSSDCSPCACVPVALFPALFANVSRPILLFCDTNSVCLYEGITNPDYRMPMRIRAISSSFSVLARDECAATRARTCSARALLHSASSRKGLRFSYPRTLIHRQPFNGSFFSLHCTVL